MKNKLIFTSVIIFVFQSPLFASEAKDSLYRMTYIDAKVFSITTDVSLYLGWATEDKEAMAKSAATAIQRLEKIRKELASLELPDDVRAVRDLDVALIDKLKEIYTQAPQNSQENISASFILFNKMYELYSEEFGKVREKYGISVDQATSFNSSQEELKLLSDEKDKATYRQALELIKNKKYQKAYDLMDVIKKNYFHSSFEDVLLLRMSDCLLMSGSDIKSVEGDRREEVGLGYLTMVISKREGYSPVLFEAYFKWRTAYQAYNYGMSNYSHIPGKEYTRYWWVALQRVNCYAKEHREDSWAKKQIEYFLGLPGIERGSPYGNMNLIYWSQLYAEMTPEIASSGAEGIAKTSK